MEVSGYPHAFIKGVSDTALARNITLSRALRDAAEPDVVLMLDDDMIVPRNVSRQLVAWAHELGHPVSAVYLTESKAAAAFRYRDGEDWRAARWVTGLGALAIPLMRLRELAEKSSFLKGSAEREDIFAFCWSGPGVLRPDGPLEWLSEDYCLTGRLGGVLLAPVAVGHIKTAALWPDDTTLQRVREGGGTFRAPETRADGAGTARMAAEN
jgi:hypothetical protein